jgi:hypothetical protein
MIRVCGRSNFPNVKFIDRKGVGNPATQGSGWADGLFALLVNVAAQRYRDTRVSALQQRDWPDGVDFSD